MTTAICGRPLADMRAWSSKDTFMPGRSLLTDPHRAAHVLVALFIPTTFDAADRELLCPIIRSLRDRHLVWRLLQCVFSLPMQAPCSRRTQSSPGCRRCGRSGPGRGRRLPGGAGWRRPSPQSRCRAGGTSRQPPAAADASARHRRCSAHTPSPSSQAR